MQGTKSLTTWKRVEVGGRELQLSFSEKKRELGSVRLSGNRAKLEYCVEEQPENDDRDRSRVRGARFQEAGILGFCLYSLFLPSRTRPKQHSSVGCRAPGLTEYCYGELAGMDSPKVTSCVGIIQASFCNEIECAA